MNRQLTYREPRESGVAPSWGWPLGRMFDDTTIDPQTGALLGRFIAEERDSLRMFQACYQALCTEEACRSGTPSGSPVAASQTCAA